MDLTAEDRLDMIELVAIYNQAIDRRDGAAWAATFIEDGVFEVEGRAPVAGRDALVAMVAAMDTTAAERHWTTNFVIAGDAAGATMKTDLAVLRGNEILLTGRYTDTLVRADGHWRFSKRVCTPDARG